jgi:hypothetical protein
MKPFTSHFDLSPKVKVSFRSVALCVRCFAGSADRVGALQSRFEEQRKLTAMPAPHPKSLAQTRSEQRNMEAALSLLAPAVARWAFRVGTRLRSTQVSPARRALRGVK